VLFEIGDRLNISHPIGLTNKDIQVIGIQEVDRGRWRVQFVEYDEGKFSNDIVSGPNYNDTSLPDPLDVPAVLNLQRSEEVYQNENGIYASRIRATWDELSNYPYTHQYRYGVYVGSTLIWQGITNETQLVTGAIQEKVTYTISVVAVNPATLATSPASTTTITAQGKSLKPSDVPQITAIQTGASAVKLTCLPWISTSGAMKCEKVPRGTGLRLSIKSTVLS
jgi:predicted phage tail protein